MQQVRKHYKDLNSWVQFTKVIQNFWKWQFMRAHNHKFWCKRWSMQQVIKHYKNNKQLDTKVYSWRFLYALRNILCALTHKWDCSCWWDQATDHSNYCWKVLWSDTNKNILAIWLYDNEQIVRKSQVKIYQSSSTYSSWTLVRLLRLAGRSPSNEFLSKRLISKRC